MIHRRFWQFDIGTWTDEQRRDLGLLAGLLRSLIPHADIDVQSVKTDTSILSIEIEEPEA